MMLSSPDCSLAPQGGSLWLVQESPCELHQFLAQLENPIPLPILRGWYRGDHGHTPFDSPERRRICTGLLREIPQPLSHFPCRYAFAYVAQTCRHNFLNKVEVRMGAIKAHTRKELVEQAKIAEKLAQKFETPKTRWESTTKVMTRLNLLIH